MRLIQQQQLGPREHRPRSGHALHHPARELAQRLVRARGHPDGEQRPPRTRRLAERVQARVKAQVLARRELAIEQRVVAEPADAGRATPSVRAGARNRARAGRPACGAKQAREDAQQRGLARSVRAEHRERLPRPAARARPPCSAARSPKWRVRRCSSRASGTPPPCSGDGRSNHPFLGIRDQRAHRRLVAAPQQLDRVRRRRRRSIRRRPCGPDRWATCPSPSRATRASITASRA